MNEVVIVILNGLLFASYLFLVSAGLTFIYGVMRILNVAHGSLYGLGAYTGAWLVLRLWPGGSSGSGVLPPALSYLGLLLCAIFLRVAGVTYPIYQCLLPVVALLAAGLVWFVVNRTRFGKLIVAVIADREVSAALGVNVPGIYTFAFALGAVLAAVGGAFIAPMSSVVPGISVEVIILAFAVTTIGGLGSVPGASIGAILVGLL